MRREGLNAITSRNNVVFKMASLVGVRSEHTVKIDRSEKKNTNGSLLSLCFTNNRIIKKGMKIKRMIMAIVE